MNPKTKFVIAVSFIANPSPLLSQNNTTTTTDVLRIGYFPNINHAQAVIGLGNGDFQKILGDIKVETQILNAGPSAIEALFANRVDVTYVGPNPAINGYIKSDGEVLRIISGAASGGAVFVVRNDAGINSADDFAGKKICLTSARQYSGCSVKGIPTKKWIQNYRKWRQCRSNSSKES